MGRYLKYLEIVNRIDEALEEKTAGKVDMSKDLPTIRNLLEVQKLALEMSLAIDRMDDDVKSAFKLYSKGDQSSKELLDHLMQGMNESSRGRDFRDRREDSPFERGDSARSWFPQGRSDEMNWINDMRDRSRGMDDSRNAHPFYSSRGMDDASRSRQDRMGSESYRQDRMGFIPIDTRSEANRNRSERNDSNRNASNENNRSGGNS